MLPPLFVHSSLNKPQSIPLIHLWNRVAITGAPYFPYFTSSKSPLNGHFHLLITTWFHQPQALYQCLKDYFPSHRVIDWIIQLFSNMSTVIYEVKTLFNRKDTKNTNLPNLTKKSSRSRFKLPLEENFVFVISKCCI